MKWYIGIIGVLLNLSGSCFENSYADSLWQEASIKPESDGIEFLLENSYSVFSRNMNDGVEWMEKTRSITEKYGDPIYLGRAHLSLGIVTYLRGDYEKCISNYLRALEIFEGENNAQWIGRTCNELSVYSRKQKQYKKGLEYLDRSYEECMSCEDYGCVETSLNNRGVIYEMMGKWDKAVTYYKKAEKIALKTNNQLGLSYILNNLAEVYRIKEDYDSAIYYVDESTKIRTQMGDVQGVAINWSNKGEIYYEKGDDLLAVEWLQKGLEKADSVHYTDLLSHTHLFLFKTFQRLNETEKSLFHLERSYQLKDSLLNEQKINSLSEMEIKYETEKTEKSRVLEQQKRVEAELEVVNRDKWIYAISGILSAVILLALFVIQIRAKKAQSEKNKAVLLEREKGLEALFDATENERRRIAKDLHDGVGQQLSGLKLAWSNLSENEEKVASEKLKALTKILDETADEVREISHQMMPKVLQEYGLVSAIEEMLDKTLSFSNLQYDFDCFNILNRYDQKIELALYRVCQELVNNVIKHAKAKQLNVQLFRSGNQLVLMVEDDGQGMDLKQSSDGHGITNIKSRLNTVNGEVNYEAGSLTGTIVTVRVKLDQST